MTVWRLIFREILHRKLGFALALLSVIVAVAAVTAVLGLLRLYDRRTNDILAVKEAAMQEREVDLQSKKAETETAMKKLEDDYRKIMLKLEFNVLILPRDQDLGDLYAEDFAAKTMPQEYADRLAKSKVVTINHILPTLQQRVVWKEKDRTIHLVGTRGEVPILHQNEKKPLRELVPKGKMILGHELHRTMKLKVGDKVDLLGASFIIHKLNQSRGNRDDITAWIDLGEAQVLLDKKGLINGIWALECNCEADRLDKVRAEIAKVLPDTQVVEKYSQAVTRAEARVLAAVTANSVVDRAREAVTSSRADMESARADRLEQRRRQEEQAALLVPLVLLACVVWLGVLAFTNVRDRAGELGILRALGVQSPKLLVLVLGRALLLGVVGAVVGVGIGVSAAVALGERPEAACAWCTAMNWQSLGLTLGLTPLVCALASALPALKAARQDPAVLFRDS